MKVKGLDNKIYNLSLSKPDLTVAKSKLHLQVRDLLYELFLRQLVYEEVYLPGSNGLYLDFLILHYNLAIEAHGEQHFKFNKFFYTNKMDFNRAQHRDKVKDAWCSLNGFKLVSLHYNEDVGEWKNKILKTE